MNVSHTAGRDEPLLQGFVLQAQVLLTLSAPAQLQQTLDDLWMTPQGRMHQRTLTALVHVIHLTTNHIIKNWKDWWKPRSCLISYQG